MDRVFYFIMDARRIQCLAERVLELGLEAVRRFVWPRNSIFPGTQRMRRVDLHYSHNPANSY